MTIKPRKCEACGQTFVGRKCGACGRPFKAPRCELCGQRLHKLPKRRAVYGLTCPGPSGTETDQTAFKVALEQATYVQRHYGIDAASDPLVVQTIVHRRDAAVERGRSLPTRSVVAAAELQADADLRTLATAQETGAVRYARDADFEVGMDALTVEADALEPIRPTIATHLRVPNRPSPTYLYGGNASDMELFVHGGES